MLFFKYCKSSALILCTFVFFALSPAHSTVIDGKITKKSRTPIQDQIFNKPLDAVSNEEISNAFVEAVFGADIEFTKKGKIRKVVTSSNSFYPNGIKYIETEGEKLNFDANNPEHTNLFERHGFSVQNRIQKFDKNHTVTFQVNVSDWPSEIQTEVQTVKAALFKDFNVFNNSLKEETGLKFSSFVFASAIDRNMVKPKGPKIIFTHCKIKNPNSIGRRMYITNKLPFPLRRRSVFVVDFSEEKYPEFAGGISISRENIIFNSYCGRSGHYMYGPLGQAIPGCILKSIGLPNLKYFGKTEYGLLFAKILYDDRIKSGMTEEETRAILPEIIQEILPPT